MGHKVNGRSLIMTPEYNNIRVPRREFEPLPFSRGHTHTHRGDLGRDVHRSSSSTSLALSVSHITLQYTALPSSYLCGIYTWDPLEFTATHLTYQSSSSWRRGAQTTMKREGRSSDGAHGRDALQQCGVQGRVSGCVAQRPKLSKAAARLAPPPGPAHEAARGATQPTRPRRRRRWLGLGLGLKP